MIVVGDSSPLIGLSAIGRLDLLRALYGSVLIPPAVAAEIAAGEERPGGRAVAEADRITEADVADATPVPLAGGLGAGETAAIRLALALGADRLLVDDLPARKEAVRLGLSVTGSAACW